MSRSVRLRALFLIALSALFFAAATAASPVFEDRTMADGSPLPSIPQWYTAAELAGLPGLPGTARRILTRAEAEGWQSRPRTKGKGLEYAFESLPGQTRAALLLRHAPKPAHTSKRALSDADLQTAWTRYEQLPATCRAAAENRQAVLHQIDVLVRAGMTQERAIDAVRTQRMADGFEAPDRATVLAWRKLVKGVRRDSWLPYLAPKWGTASRPKVEICDEAVQFFKVDYLRLQQPCASHCYERLERVARARGWVLPSLKTMLRRIAELPVQLVVLCREGEEALMKLYPTRPRDRSCFVALEAVCTDGHVFDVFGVFEDGSIGRSVIVAFQDLYSGKLLSWRIGQTESSDLVRLAWGDLVEQWGIPSQLYLDNGRAFASKYLSGGTPTRYRFKVMPEDPLGVWPQMGVELHWTNPYNGKAKPIERAWLDLIGRIAKHPRCAGAYTGNSPTAKPEDYGSRAVPIGEFRTLVAEAIADHNAKTGRRSPVNAGRSFDATFSASYSQVPIRRATAEQRRLWMLKSEAVTVRGTGHAVLMGNHYWDEALAQHIGQKVVLRVDPEALQTSAHVYALDGTYLCEAKCFGARGFNDIAAATEHARGKTQFTRATKALKQAELRMQVAQLDQQLIDTRSESGEVLAELPRANVIKPAAPGWDGVPKVKRDPEREAVLAEQVEQMRRQLLRDAI